MDLQKLENFKIDEENEENEVYNSQKKDENLVLVIGNGYLHDLQKLLHGL